MTRHVYDLDSVLLLSTKPSEIFIVCKDGSGLICNGSEVILKQNIPFDFFGEACSLYFYLNFSLSNSDNIVAISSIERFIAIIDVSSGKQDIIDIGPFGIGALHLKMIASALFLLVSTIW
jgi:cytochrome b subunit of formate dehydrogenase